MATFDTKGALAELEVIADQITASQASGSEGRTLSNRTKAFAGVLSDNAGKFAEVSGDSEDEIFSIATKLERYAGLVGPIAVSVEWKSEEVQAKVAALKAFETLGLLTDDQVTMLNSFASTLSKGSGVRGPRNEADVIEGRPTRVEIKRGSEVESNMAANKAQSPGNLANRLGSILGVTDKTSDAYKALKAYSNQVCIDGKTVAIPAQDSEGNDIVITLTPFEPEGE
ncbi:MAG TPA: hypothetical protein VGF75_05070 [Candidatus Saccharimonadales bacterium]|jgi:hypothetical protein